MSHELLHVIEHTKRQCLFDGRKVIEEFRERSAMFGSRTGRCARTIPSIHASRTRSSSLTSLRRRGIVVVMAATPHCANRRCLMRHTA